MAESQAIDAVAPSVPCAQAIGIPRVLETRRVSRETDSGRAVPMISRSSREEPSVTPDCIICKSSSRFYFAAGATRYYQCRRCLVVFTDHVPQASYDEWSKTPGYASWEEYLHNTFTRVVEDIKRV